jgi:type IV pilus assembly protein PilP
MFNNAKNLAWLIMFLCVGGSVGAEEKIVTPSQKSKEAVDKFNAAPSAVGKTLQDLGKTIGAKLGLGSSEVKATSEVAPVSLLKKENQETQPPSAPVIGKRDPFRPFTLNNRPTQLRRENLSPLQRYEVGQLKLVGVIWDVKEPNAMVEDSAGLGYVVRIGTLIGSNEGKVKAIQPARIVIEEFEIDLYGAKKKIDRTMRLAPEKAE